MVSGVPVALLAYAPLLVVGRIWVSFMKGEKNTNGF